MPNQGGVLLLNPLSFAMIFLAFIGFFPSDRRLSRTRSIFQQLGRE